VSGNPAVDVSKMISILQGSKLSVKPPSGSSSQLSKTPPAISVKPGVVRPGVSPVPPVLDRVVQVNPKALPKGMGTQVYMKKGNTPAVGLPDRPGTGGSATAYMKKGNGRAEGEAERGVPVVVRIKDGRPQAESNPSHHGGGAPAQNLSSNGGGSSYPGTSHGHAPVAGGSSYPTAPSIAYRVDSTSQLSTNSVKFRKGSTELADAGSYYYLQNLAAALRDPSLSGDRFVVEGHASAEGSETSNLILSQQRANSIFDFMISQGVQPERLLSIGHGEFHAQYSPADPEYLRAQDRQVMVFKLAE